MPDVLTCLDCGYTTTDPPAASDHKATNVTHRMVPASMGELPGA